IFNIIILSFGSIPVFVWTFTLQYFLCWKLDLFPFVFPNGTNLLTLRMFHGAIIPILALSLGPISTYMYVLRGSLLESYHSDYVALLRVKGLSKWQIIRRHTFKNAIVSIFPEIFSNVIFIVTNSFIIEKIFAIAGLSITYIRTFFALDRSRHSEWLMTLDLGVVPDYNMFLCISMFYVAIAVGTGFLLDLLYGIIDPRIRIGSNKNSE
ncbi:MAG: ABC transporter permease, partial [Lachnospiraceae bacterium]|nr:ABC transporter permease [Lachnospiraceae bacterium]